jgi:ribonuclease P protein component
VLKKINRISKRKDFEEVRNKGKLYYSPLWGCLVLKTEEKGKQFGLVVSKKISKKAVVRNKVKRLLSEAIRRNLGGFSEGYKMVFLVKQAIVGKSSEEMEVEIKKLW